MNAKLTNRTNMNDTPYAATAFVLTRRALVKNFAWASAAFAVFPRAFREALGGSGHAAQISPPIVSFYMDRLYLDHTGTAIPYLSPRGMRSAAPLAHLSEEAFRRAQLYV
jgi:hypothetical protein